MALKWRHRSLRNRLLRSTAGQTIHQAPADDRREDLQSHRRHRLVVDAKLVQPYMALGLTLVRT